jgi:hypothetical protein
MSNPTEGYVVCHVLRAKRDSKGRPTGGMDTLDALPDPKDVKSGYVSYITGRTITLPGFAPSNVWGPLDMAGSWPLAEARKRARHLDRRTALVLDVATVTEWERVRHVARARAKARKIGKR